MKNPVYAILIATAFGLATAGVSHAMSELASVSIEPEWPATSNPGTVILYQVTVTRAGQGLLEVSLSSHALPHGAAVSFSPSLLRFTGCKPAAQTATMTITCTNVTPTDTCPFTVTGAAQRQSITITNQALKPFYSVISGPPKLALDPLGRGGLRLRGKGATGHTYQIESAPNLIHPAWTPVGSSTADGNGRFTFMAADTKDASKRFYRAVCLAPTQAPRECFPPR